MRDMKMDNIKGFLIFCVVLGHMLELVDMGGIYRILYSFHMPVFIFLSGYFAKFQGKKIIMTLICPYFLFQVLYLLFDALILKKDMSALKLQFTTPYWLLWYLMALIFYYLLLPFIESIRHKRILLAVVCILSLAAGYDQTIGYYLTLSRFITFFPYFLLGVMMRQTDMECLLKNIAFRLINTAMIAAMCLILCTTDLISRKALYGSYSYADANASVMVRLLLLFTGVSWCFFFLCYFPRKRIPLLTTIGENTLTVFLLHGFIRNYMKTRETLFVYDRYGNRIFAILISLAIVIILGNQYAGKGFRFLFLGGWADALSRKRV